MLYTGGKKVGLNYSKRHRHRKSEREKEAQREMERGRYVVERKRERKK